MTHSIQFYQMLVQDIFGKPMTYHGAVVFGDSARFSATVLRVVSPMPSLSALYQTLQAVHAEPGRERLHFFEMSRDEIVFRLQRFCEQGQPLPDVFEPSTARLDSLTVFQLSCYQSAAQIPHGETRPYAWLAERMRKSGAERAVGGAMRANPFPLLIPCHRVVKKDGNLGGFLGATSPESWQLGLKRTLLEIEGLHQQPSLFSYAAALAHSPIQ